MKTPKHRLGDPATAIVRAQGAVLHNHHLGVGQLDALFARRNQNSEIGDSCFGPFAKTLCDLGLVAFVHGIELAALRRGARADQPISHTIEFERPHRSLDVVFLVIFESSRWDIEACDTNAGIETLEERVAKLLLLGQSRQPFLDLPHFVDIERNHRYSTAHFSQHLLLLFLSGKGQIRRPLPPVSSLSWAENEVRFPARFAKNRTSSVVYGQFNAVTSSLLPFFLLCLLGKNKQGVC